MDSTVTEQYVKRLATCTPGASGADIANICNEAAIHAARMSSSSVSTADFENALERITAGLEKRVSVVPEDEVELSAYYVAAQSLLSWVLPTLTPVLKVSIVSRVNKPLGFIQFAPRGDLLATKEHLTDLLCRGLAGKASQLLFFNKHTDQAQSDLKRITEVAYNMIAVHGMGVSVPNLSLQSQENSRITMWSNRLQNEIDEEVNHVVQDQYERARDEVVKYKDVIEILAKELIKKKSLAEDDVKRLFESSGISSH